MVANFVDKEAGEFPELMRGSIPIFNPAISDLDSSLTVQDPSDSDYVWEIDEDKVGKLGDDLWKIGLGLVNNTIWG